MIAGQVGEDRGAKGEAVDAALIEAVRGNFHGDARSAAVDQRGECRLEIDGTGRREVARLTFDRRPRRIERAERPDRPHRPERAQHMPGENDRRRLAVGSRHPDHLQP